MAYVKDLEFFSYNTINLEGLRRFNLFILPQENFGWRENWVTQLVNGRDDK